MSQVQKQATEILQEKQGVKRRCLWLKVGKKPLYCWQKGKRIKETKCTACLLARIAQSVTAWSARRIAKQ